MKRAEPRDGKSVGSIAYSPVQLSMLGIPGAPGLISSLGAMPPGAFTHGIPYTATAAFGQPAVPGAVLPTLPHGLANAPSGK